MSKSARTSDRSPGSSPPKSSDADTAFLEIVRRTAERYKGTSVTAWQFARGKLRGDPLYRAALCNGLLPSGGTLIDVGCGQGLMLALLADGARIFEGGEWPAGWQDPPRFHRLVGIETRVRPAQIAKRALDGVAEIVHLDARRSGFERCTAVLFFDVLHMMPYNDQEKLMAAAAAALEPGGVMLVREANAAGGWRFQGVRVGNSLKAFALGFWKQRFFFRTADEWRACFSRYGSVVDIGAMSEGTPFANVMFRVTRAP